MEKPHRQKPSTPFSALLQFSIISHSSSRPFQFHFEIMMLRPRISFVSSTSTSSLFSGHCRSRFLLSYKRWISSTPPLHASWMDTIKGVFTGQKSSPDATSTSTSTSSESFTLLRFADELSRARKVGAFKQYIVGRSSQATFSDAFEKQEAIIRYLGGFDATGENISTIQKKEAANHCSCSIADVENALSKFTWAKEAQRKIEKLKEEGKPMPKSLAEVQKLMGSTPMDVARSNLAKSGQISRNSPCPCGSKKLYKRCCGKDGKSVGATKV